MTSPRLPAEWEPQDAIFLTWPHKDSGWEHQLDELVQLYEALVSVICDFADLVIAIPEADIEEVRGRLASMDVPLEYVYFYPAVSTDTWVRNFGPITVQTEEGMKLLDFTFKARGNMRLCDLDNRITKSLYDQNAFPFALYEAIDFVLEGGSIESDGKGTLLVRSSSLLNGNPHLSKDEIEAQLKKIFGLKKINWLESGHLAGEDVGGHIDSLARLCPNNIIVYTACDDEQDEHYIPLKNLEAELKAMTNAEGQSYHLLPLPWAGAVFGDSDQRVPASYANFLVVNEAVLVPIYNALSDEDALDVVSQAFPGYEIFGIPCLSLIERGGSLHGITMHLPEGVLLQA